MPDYRSNIALPVILLALFYCFGTIECGWSQSSVISGEVRAADTGLPLSDVNVFLSSTNLGSATDREGNYLIRKVPNGVYKLVFSYIGFKTHTVDLTLLEADSLSFDVNLKPDPVQLEALNVTAERDREWKRNLEVFEREFIGTTANAVKTKILNPEILVFEWNDSGTILSARTDQELNIINRALGYRIRVVLNTFEYIARDRSRNLEDVVEYLVYPRFEELPDSVPSQRERWVENREETYQGSFRHFLFSLYHDRVSAEGFRIENGQIERLAPSEEDYLLRYRPMQSEYRKSLKGYRIQTRSSRTRLAIDYNNSAPSYLSNTDNNYFFVNEYGKLLDVRSLVIGGLWFRNRLADELPLNYTATGQHTD